MMVATLVSTATFAYAQGDEGASQTENEAKLDRAKDLFRQGVALFQAGRIEGALALFMQSRETFPSSKNTINAALCLEQLGKLDEALELYEEVLRLHGPQLDAENRGGVEVAIRRLDKRVGGLQVASNAKGSLVVDGRLRGEVPMRGPLRLSPGRHVIRVLADGYAAFESEVEIRAGESGVVDARLERLTQSGGLRVEVDGEGAAQVFVDGAMVGQAPWEGTLAPGPHLVQTRSDEVGSAPAKAVVVEGQTVLLRVKSRPLGPRQIFDVTPTTALLTVDGVALGTGRWDGFLPEGAYVVAANEEGYFPTTRALEVQAGKNGTEVVSLRLRVDEEHPRWPKPPKAHLWVGAVGGWGVGGGLGSGPEQACPKGCSSDPPATGFMVGARAGFELPVPLSIELTVGYMSLWRSIDRDIAASFTNEGSTWPLTYALEDTIRIRGPFVAGGASYRVPIRKQWSLVSRATVGAWFGQSTDTVTGMAGDEPLNIADAGKSVSSTLVFVIPELSAQWDMAPWSLSAGMSVLFAPKAGPTLPHGEMGAAPDRCGADPGSAACARQSPAIEDERAYGPFAMFLPQVSISRRF
jgi:PEGA domain/Tetratricopeptide repeat